MELFFDNDDKLIGFVVGLCFGIGMGVIGTLILFKI